MSLRPAWATLRPPSPKQTRNYKQKFAERSGASRKRAGGQRPGLGLRGRGPGPVLPTPSHEVGRARALRPTHARARDL